MPPLVADDDDNGSGVLENVENMFEPWSSSVADLMQLLEEATKEITSLRRELNESKHLARSTKEGLRAARTFAAIQQNGLQISSKPATLNRWSERMKTTKGDETGQRTSILKALSAITSLQREEQQKTAEENERMAREAEEERQRSANERKREMERTEEEQNFRESFLLSCKLNARMVGCCRKKAEILKTLQRMDEEAGFQKVGQRTLSSVKRYSALWESHVPSPKIKCSDTTVWQLASLTSMTTRLERERGQLKQQRTQLEQERAELEQERESLRSREREFAVAEAKLRAELQEKEVKAEDKKKELRFVLQRSQSAVAAARSAFAASASLRSFGASWKAAKERKWQERREEGRSEASLPRDVDEQLRTNGAAEENTEETEQQREPLATPGEGSLTRGKLKVRSRPTSNGNSGRQAKEREGTVQEGVQTQQQEQEEEKQEKEETFEEEQVMQGRRGVRPHPLSLSVTRMRWNSQTFGPSPRTDNPDTSCSPVGEKQLEGGRWPVSPHLVASLSRRLKEEAKKRERAEKMRDAAENNVAEETKKVGALEAEVEKLADKLTAVQREKLKVEDGKKDALSKLNSVSRELEATKEQLCRTKNVAANVEALEHTAHRLRDELASECEKVESLQKEKADANRQTSMAEVRLNDISAELETALQELHKLQRTAASLEKEKRNVLQTAQEAEEKAKAAEQECESVREQLRKALEVRRLLSKVEAEKKYLEEDNRRKASTIVILEKLKDFLAEGRVRAERELEESRLRAFQSETDLVEVRKAFEERIRREVELQTRLSAPPPTTQDQPRDQPVAVAADPPKEQEAPPKDSRCVGWRHVASTSAKLRRLMQAVSLRSDPPPGQRRRAIHDWQHMLWATEGPREATKAVAVAVDLYRSVSKQYMSQLKLQLQSRTPFSVSLLRYPPGQQHSTAKSPATGSTAASLRSTRQRESPLSAALSEPSHGPPSTDRDLPRPTVRRSLFPSQQ